MAFIDRVVEFPGRVQLTNVSGDVYDMVRAEGDEYTEGTLLNAVNLNQQTQLDSAVKSAFTTAGMSSGTYQNDMSDALKFLLDAHTLQTSGDWTYLTIGELFLGSYNAQKTFAISNTSGNIYLSASQSLTYPVAFSALPFAYVTNVYSGYPTWTIIGSSSTTGISFTVASSLSRSSTTYRVKALVFGVLA